MENRVPYQQVYLRLKPYSVKEFCCIYEITDKTFRKWLMPFSKEIGTRNGRYYSVIQARIIFSKLGVPGIMKEE